MIAAHDAVLQPRIAMQNYGPQTSAAKTRHRASSLTSTGGVEGRTRIVIMLITGKQLGQTLNQAKIVPNTVDTTVLIICRQGEQRMSARSTDTDDFVRQRWGTPAV